MFADRTCRTHATANICGPGTQHGSVKTLRAPGTKFHDRPSLRSPRDTVGLRSDQALVIDAQKHHGFYKLCLDRRTAHGNDGFSGKDRRSFWNSPHITAEMEFPQIFQKFLAEDMLRVEKLDIFIGKLQIFQIVDELLYAGHNSKTAIIGHFTEKHIEIANGILKTIGKIAVRHCQLIKIGQHG